MIRYCATVALLLTFGGSFARAGVVISEIMFNPQGSDRDSTGSDYTYNREWVELYNPDDLAVDLSGWQFGDAHDNNWASPFPSGTTLGPGQALVVAGDVASFDANWGTAANRVLVDAFPNLANSFGTDEIAALRDNLGVLRDEVPFQNAGWPTANGSDGNSVFLLPGALTAAANDNPANWRPSSYGLYGGRWVNGGGEGENHGSPGFVSTQPQAAFAPSPDAAWSMVVIPDTQNYVKNTRDLPVLHQMIGWIKDNRDAYNIKLVMQEGDIVNQNSQVTPTSGNQSADQQWANAREAFSALDGYLPYLLAVGNHDIGTTNAQSRDTQFNTYFQPSQNPLNDPVQGGILKGVQEVGKLQNAYFEVKGPDGRDLLIVTLEYWPRQSSVDWANMIAALPKYQNHTAILLTHSYMDWDEEYWVTGATVGGLGTDGNDGEDMWNELVSQHGNFEMTFNGHIGGDGVGFKESVGLEGNAVYQMLLNTQFETNGGNGWFRVVEFLKDGKTARIRTYSPFLDLQRTNAANSFEIDLAALYNTPVDFNQDGVIDGADLAVWSSHHGMTGVLQVDGDANGDGSVDGADFLAWQRGLGASPSATTAAGAVPEPASLAMMALALAAACGLAPRRRGH